MQEKALKLVQGINNIYIYIRAGRVVRVVELVRLVRIAKLYKSAS